MTARYVLLDEIPGQARACVRLHGPDTRRFLQGTLTANVETLRPGHALAAALCTVKGKLVTELVLLPGADEAEVLALIPSEVASAVAEHFDRHIIMDDVEVEDQGAVAVALVWGQGDQAPEVADGLDAFATRHPAPGWLVVGPAEQLTDALSGLEHADVGAFTSHRIATASPAWGHELAADFFPPEMGFVHAVSYDKGCFLGQEPLARIHARGQVNRVMVRVQAQRAPSAEVVLASDDRADVGRLTTFAPAPDGGVHGLAIVRRAVAETGTALTTVGDDVFTVNVMSGPLGDDPGVSGRGRAATVKLGGPR